MRSTGGCVSRWACERRTLAFRLGAPSFGFGSAIHVLLRDGQILTLDATVRPFGRAKLQRKLEALRSWVPTART
ncbi:MAG: hypothetical protein ACR2HM_02300 [Acidimicrobiales bacterium]